MHFREKIINTYRTIKATGQRSLQNLAELTGYSKSSTHRQLKKIRSRAHIPGSIFFETADGATWLRTLILAVVLVFGLQANVGADRIALFFELFSIGLFVPASSRTVSRLKTRMMSELETYQKEIQPSLDAASADISIIAGADETFFKRLQILLYMDLGSGFILTEKQASNRRTETWYKNTAEISAQFKSVLCLVSERGKSLISLAKKSDVVSIADLFHIKPTFRTNLGSFYI